MAKDFSQYKLNVLKSPVDTRDWKLEALIREAEYPDTLDLRPDLNPVRDQGNQGTCAAMSGAAMKEYQEYKDVGMNEYLSPQFIYYNRENPAEEGMYMRDLMKILKTFGVPKEFLYPYGTKEKPSATIYEYANDYVIASYASINSIEGLKMSLYVNGPAVIAVPVYNYGQRMWYQRAGDSFLGGHAMSIVGYNAEGFIIRNSWGDEWNEEGYTIFPYSDWGLQWEVWTAVDAVTDPNPEPEPKKGCLLKPVLLLLASIGFLVATLVL